MNYNQLEDFVNNKLDRAFFIDGDLKKYAKMDRPLPIGCEQTISQPSLVLNMSYLLDLNKNSKVLEIGTGSGYQTAILAEFAKQVFTVERIDELAQKARERLEKLGYQNIHYLVGDGSLGWPENAPYDRIIVTAAAVKVPKELLEQLRSGGKMIIPVGPFEGQDLKLIIKDETGLLTSQSLAGVRFVELKGKYGFTS